MTTRSLSFFASISMIYAVNDLITPIYQGEKMVQDPQDLASFFQKFVQSNNEFDAEWGPGYREITSRVQKEKPHFSSQTIQDLWYARDNKIASLRQGGMSHEEFKHAEEKLQELTNIIVIGLHS